MYDSVQLHRQQPTRLPRPWHSPGKNNGVGCHFLLQCMKVKIESEFAQLCPTPSDPMYFSLPGSSVHEILQARVLEWGAIAFSDTSLWWTPNPVTYKEKREYRETHKDKGHGKIEVEIGVMLPQLGSAKDCWQPLEARREA